jgi:hypothetical protein
MLNNNFPEYSFAHHAGSFKLSVAIVIVVSGEVQHVMVDSHHFHNAWFDELTFQVEQHI